jgi:hypothetical protein
MAAPRKGMNSSMGRKLLAFLMASVLLFSYATTTLAAESEVFSGLHSHLHNHSETEHLMESHNHEETESPMEPHDHSHDHGCNHAHDHSHKHGETGDVVEDDQPLAPLPNDKDTGPEQPLPLDPENGEAPTPPSEKEAEPEPPGAPPAEQELPSNPEEGEAPAPLLNEEETEPELPEAPAEESEAPEYFLLETRDGAAIVMFGAPDEPSEPTFTPFLVGSRPCVFRDCPNTVTVHTKYDFVCDGHKCSISGCSNPAYNMNPNKCQFHAGRTDTICQIYTPENPDGLCGKPSVSSGSICCWEHHCPGCLGVGNGNATICNICRQCWVPGCPNYSTCTNECDLHCPHTCKTHHKNHCLDCHSNPCICFPANPAISVGAWNSTDNSVAVDISSARATDIELYTADGVQFAAMEGANGTHVFHYNAPQNNGSYYVRVKSEKGYNSGSFPFQVSVLDLAPPDITGKAVQPDGEVWATSKTLTVTATDQTNGTFSLRNLDDSPVPDCPDQEGTANGSSFAATWTITEQLICEKSFKIIASDHWGYSSETTVTVSGIDSRKPSKPNVLLSHSGDWHKEDVSVTISGSYADSGIADYQYRINGGEWQTGDTVWITTEGIHVVEAKAISGSGMESDMARATVKIDKTAPTASYTLSLEDWTTEPVTITLTAADTGGSGLASATLPNGETVYELSSIRFPVSQNGDYHFTVTDHAGNSAVVVVPVTNIAMLDVTVTLNVPFVLSPDHDRLYAGEISFQNHSNVPVSLTLQRMTSYGNAPELVGKDDKAWKSLSAADTKKYIALGFSGNGVDFWLDPQSNNQPHLLGTMDKGGTAAYSMQGRFGYAWEQVERFVYGMAIKVAIAHE